MSGLMLCALVAGAAQAAAKKSNMLIIWGDDIGYWNVSTCNHGMMGYETPKDFPPSQHVGSFSLERVMQKLQTAPNQAEIYIRRGRQGLALCGDAFCCFDLPCGL